MASTLRRRVLKAGLWTGSGYFISQLLRFGGNLLLTRLLMPDMFGIMAIGSLVMFGLGLISDVGLGPNVIYSKRGGDPTFLNTVWAVQIRRGILISSVALGVSAAIAVARHFRAFPAESVYANPMLPYVIALLSLGSVIEGFESTKMLEARRRLAMDRTTQIEVLSQAFGLVCMIAWVLIDRSIWALVFGSLSSTTARVIQTHLFLPGTPNRWQWDPEAFREIVHYGKWIFLSSILGFLVSSSDRIILGGILSTTLLGIYAIASLITTSVESLLHKIVVDVSFPALSEVVRERPKDLKQIYYRLHSLAASASYLIAGFLMTSGEDIIRLLYDRRYAQAGWMLEVLAAGLIALPFRVVQQCLQALGKPRLLSYIIAIRVAALYVLTPIGFHYFGLLGAIWGIVVSSLAGVPAAIVYAARHELLDYRREVLLLLLLPVGIVAGRVVSMALSNL